MKKTFFLGLVCLFSITLLGQTKTFKGAWFDVKYPSSFTVKPSLKSTTVQEGYESAFFVSPDQLVEFYVFSPQWNGNPTDILLKSSEKLIKTYKTTKGSQMQKWWTISAKDGSFTRSYYQVSDDSANTIKVIGIKYKNHQAHNKYKEHYLAFKSSLVQYAD